MPLSCYDSPSQKKLGSVKEIRGHGMHHNHVRGLRAVQRKAGFAGRQGQRLVWRYRDIPHRRRPGLLNARAVLGQTQVRHGYERQGGTDLYCQVGPGLGLPMTS